MQAQLFPVTPACGSWRAAPALAAAVVLSTIFNGLPVAAQSEPEMAGPRRIPVVATAAPYQSRSTRARLTSMQQTPPSPEVVQTPQPLESKTPLMQPQPVQQIPASEEMVPFQEDGAPVMEMSGPGCDDGCGACGDWACGPGFFWPRGRIDFHGEYLMWWTKSGVYPALATTSRAGTTLENAGVLGADGTDVLFGGESIDLSSRSGGRFTIDYWMCDCRDTGLEVVAMFLGDRSAEFNRSSQGDPILARPFFNVDTANEDSGIIAFPGQQTGSLSIRTGNELDSLEILFRRALMRQCGYQIDILAGYRYSRFAEDLAIDETSTFVGELGAEPVGTVMRLSDYFAAENQFNGAELGIVSRCQGYRWSLDLLAKLALGGTHSEMNISGSTVTSIPDESPVATAGGLLAQPTNIGIYEQDNFTVIPELGMTVGYDLTPRLKATMGYTFLYWSKVARPADAVDVNVNPTQFGSGELVGLPSPAFRFTTTDFWAQGLNFGLDFRF